MHRCLILAVFLALAAHAAQAGDLVVTVRTPQGKPVADAVVTVPGRSGSTRFPWPYRMAQHNMQFDPYVLIVPEGATVEFPNQDSVRHHVYSFSPAHPFELKLFSRGETRSVRFDKAGVIALGCNIHDTMSAFIVVVDTPYAAKTDAQGRAVIRDAPAGRQSLRVWRPYLRGANNALTVNVDIARTGTSNAAVTAAIGPAPDRARMY